MHSIIAAVLTLLTAAEGIVFAQQSASSRAGLEIEMQSRPAAIRDLANRAETKVLRQAGSVPAAGLVSSDRHESKWRFAEVDTEKSSPRPAASRSESKGGGSKIEEVVVTAQKREQRLIEVPMSISAISGDSLKQQRISNIVDLSFAVPSMAVMDRGGSGVRYVFMRGVGNPRGSSPLVGLYLDETSVTLNPGNELDLRISDLQRVEVLRGPQGTLYGDGSMGGTIRFITKDPVLDRFGTEGHVSVSFTQDGEPSEEVQGILNVPLLDSTLGLRIAGTYQKDGGWIDQPAVGRSDINGQDLANVRVKSLWKPNDALAIRATMLVHRADTGAQNVGEDERGNYAQAFEQPTTPSGKRDYEFYSLTWSYELPSVRLLSTTGYVDSLTGVTDQGYRIPAGPPAVTPPFHLLLERYAFDLSLRTQELRLTSASRGRAQWTIGGLYRDYGSKFDASIPFGTSSGPLLTIPIQVEEQADSWAIFGEASYAVTDRIEAGAGLRYFEDRRDRRDSIANTETSVSFDKLSPRAFVRYGVSNEVVTYASVSSGFRSGGFGGSVGTGQVFFAPEEIRSYEIGVKGELIDGFLDGDVSIFHSDYENYQTDVGVIVNGTPAQFTTNAGDARIEGVDFSLTCRPTNQLEFGAGGEYLEAEFTRVDGASTVSVGDPTPLVPRYRYSIWGVYEFRWSESATGFVRMDYNKQGKSEYRNRMQGDWYFGESDVIDLLNGVVGWRRSNWSIEAFAKNILNDRGYIDADGHEELAPRSRPRTYGIQVGFDFL